VPELTVLTPLRIEALAVGGSVQVTGMGPKRAMATGARLGRTMAAGAPVAVVGVAGGLRRGLRPGQLVVASEVRSLDGAITRSISSAQLLADELRDSGFEVQTGPLVTSTHMVSSGQRADLAAGGALAVDMESAWLLEHLGKRPMCVVRSISDTEDRGVLTGGWRGVASLHRMRPSLERWASASGHHDVVLASPRSFCAGVERAIEIVERALERFGAPVYVRRQIVHNVHVISRLEAMGAIFVQEFDEVPDGATVVVAAHGIAPAVRDQAVQRGSLQLIDATCPLVTKVHREARTFAAEGYDIVLVGHASHEEVEGTIGEAPERIRVVERAEDVDGLEVRRGARVAYLTQTTLATDETAGIVGALRERFPEIAGPSTSDICFATQNRQDAVRALTRHCELILVVGSANSSNTRRLVEVAEREGCRAELVEDASEVRLSSLSGVGTIGLTSGASVPDELVHEVLAALGTLGPVRVRVEAPVEEDVHFALPKQVR